MRRALPILPLFALSCPLLFAAAPAAAAQCYSMYDAKNLRVSQTATAPIDLSRSISGEMARRFPGRYLVIADIVGCAEVNSGSPGSSSLFATADADADYGGTSPAVVSPGPADVPRVRRVVRHR